MSITIDTLHEIELSLSESSKLTGNPLAMLKDFFPDLSFVRLSVADMTEPPFRSLPDYNLYLLDTREHCVQITNDLSMASGVVIAKR